MNSTFELWTVENPMTVIISDHFDGRNYNSNSSFASGGIIYPSYQRYIYTAWDYKTMNMNTIKITLSLN